MDFSSVDIASRLLSSSVAKPSEERPGYDDILVDPNLSCDDSLLVSIPQSNLRWRKRPHDVSNAHLRFDSPGKRRMMENDFVGATGDMNPCRDESLVDHLGYGSSTLHGSPLTSSAHVVPTPSISQEDDIVDQYLVRGAVDSAEETASRIQSWPPAHLQDLRSTPMPGYTLNPSPTNLIHQPHFNQFLNATERTETLSSSPLSRPSTCTPGIQYWHNNRSENDEDTVLPFQALTKRRESTLREDLSNRFLTAPNAFSTGFHPSGTDGDCAMRPSGGDSGPENAVLPQSAPKLLSIPLLEHQKQGLAWMSAIEDSEQKGGILADDMGLGKTIQALSLITSRPSSEPGRRATLVVMPAGLISQWEQEIKRLLPRASPSTVYVLHGNKGHVDFATLNGYEVVLTSFGTVALELRKKQGGGWRRRGMTLAHAQESYNLPILGSASTWHRVILDEAQGIKNDRSRTALACCEINATYRWCLTGTPVMNNLRELYSLLKFLRIQPFSGLDAFNRTFVPPEDLSRNQDGHAVQLQAALRTVLLRRTTSTIINGQPIIHLPPITIENVYIELNDTEQRLYTAVEDHSQLQCSQYRNTQGARSNITHMLSLLRRLQQACCHPFLIPDLEVVAKRAFENDMQRAINASRFSSEVVMRLQENEGSLGECPICLYSVKSPLIFPPCGHSICKECFGKISFPVYPGDSVRDGNSLVRCPICRGPINAADVSDYNTIMRYHHSRLTGAPAPISWFTPLERILNVPESDCPSGSRDRHMGGWFADDPNCTDVPVQFNLVSTGPVNPTASNKPIISDDIVRQRYRHALWMQWMSSSKIDKALEIVQQIRADGTGDKIIIFSQYTSLLDIFEIPLCQRRWAFSRYDGSMKREARQRALDEYVKDPECAVMLVSLRAGNSGLNLTVASHVIILDPSWNPYVEDQAVGRVYRFGQQKPVYVRRLLVPNTVEDRIRDLQEQKRNLTSCILKEGSEFQTAQSERNDLAYLLGLAEPIAES